MADAVLLRSSADRQLVVAAELQLAVDDVVDRVGAPLQVVRRPAARGGAAAPLVGEHDGLAVVGERRAVPVGEARVGHRVDPLRVRRVADVDQQAVALAGAGGDVERRVDRDVVAGVRVGRGPQAMPDGWFGVCGVFCRPLMRSPVGEQARLIHHGRGLRRGDRHLDDLDAPARGVLRLR